MDDTDSMNPMDDDAYRRSAAERRYLLLQNAEAVARAWRAARQQSADPVVWVLALRRPKPVAIAETLGIDVPSIVSEAAEAGGIPTAITALPRDKSLALVAGLTANGERVLNEGAQAGHFQVVVVCGGGNLYAQWPCPED